MSLSVTSLGVDRASFRIVDCTSCRTQALVYFDFDDAGQEVSRCLHCHAPVAAEQGSIRPGSARAVESLGYVFLHRSKKDPRAQKLSGCGAKGVKSCGSGGCSSGSCGTGGGGCGGGCGSK